MIDVSQIRHNFEAFKQQIRKKEPLFDVDKLLHLDTQVRELLVIVEDLRRKKNELAQQAKGGVTEQIRAESIVVGKELSEKEQLLRQVKIDYEELCLSCPNIPSLDIPDGGKENNKVIREYGVKPVFSFVPKNHIELGEQNGWFSLDEATKIAASGFVFYKGDGVKLIYALTRFMLQHNESYGFEVVLPPYLANEQTLTASGNFPKFRDNVYEVQDGLFLIPTSEVSLASRYRDDILSEEKLPVRMTAWSSCFRREAGGYGKNERGLIRIHQFEKVELFTICTPEESEREHEKMLACSESLLQKLGLHYRVSLLAAQDCSFQASKTYDIEAWLPTQNGYYEVSSASNCTDFQARRGKIRYKKSAEDKTHFVHTLNTSSLALSRLTVALMETYQQEDGSIIIPDVLQKFMW